MENNNSRDNKNNVKLSEKDNNNMDKINTNIKGRKESRDYPATDIEDAINVTKQLDRYGGKAKPSDLGALLGRKGGWLGVSIVSTKRYGFIEGYGELTITELGKKVIHPTYPQEDKEAMREAFFNVKLFKEIYEKFKGNYLEDEMFANFLIRNYNLKDKKGALRLVNIIKHNTELIQIESINLESEKLELETSQNRKEIKSKGYSLTKIDISLFEIIKIVVELSVYDKLKQIDKHKEIILDYINKLQMLSQDYPKLNSTIEAVLNLYNNTKNIELLTNSISLFMKKLKEDLNIQDNIPREDNAEDSTTIPGT